MKKQLLRIAWPWSVLVAALGVGGYEGSYYGSQWAIDKVCNDAVHKACGEAVHRVSKPIERFSDTLTAYETGQGQTVWMTVGEARHVGSEYSRLLDAIGQLHRWASDGERGELMAKLAELGI